MTQRREFLLAAGAAAASGLAPAMALRRVFLRAR